MSECTHDCSSCSAACSSRAPTAEEMKMKLNERSSVKKVYAILSGKGGVGKSMVTSLMASAMQKRGHQAAVLDADLTGPSIPKAFGIHCEPPITDNGLTAVKTEGGVEVMSINLLLQNETDPVIWRGPVIAGVVRQFWTDVDWTDVDYMFVDMPPGTGDVPLTVFQSLPVDGIIIVTSPQELVSMIVEKAVKMATTMNVPIVGIVENMSYFECDECGKKHYILGESNIDRVAKKYLIHNVTKLPMDPKLAAMCDNGEIEKYDASEAFDGLCKVLESR